MALISVIVLSATLSLEAIFLRWKISALGKSRQAADKCGGTPARQRARGWNAVGLNGYFGGGTIFITNDVGFSVGPNGPGTLLLTDGMALR
jgi:hypothetical protein